MKIMDMDINPTDLIIAEAFSRFVDDIDIYNNSWNPTGFEWLAQPEPLTLAAMKRAVTGEGGTAGRNGLGAIFVFSAGNEYLTDNDPGPTDGKPDWRTDYSGFSSSRLTINVAAVGHDGVKVCLLYTSPSPRD